MDVEAQGVAFALGPGDDVGGAQKSWVGDAGQRTAAVPVFEQSLPKD